MRTRHLVFSGLALLILWCAVQLWRIADAGAIRTAPSADVAIILGAAAYDARPSPVFAERLRHAATLYRSARVPLLMVTGGRGHKARFSEAEVGRRFLIAQGVPASAIRIEERSRTTLQNLVEARRVLGAGQGIERALIVSDPPHMLRALSMARAQGFAALPAPTPTTRYRSWQTRWPFALRELWFLHVWWVVRQ